jgi:DNA-binding NarL/FixJ family response regulator
MRILIADDQALFRDALASLMAAHGHDVVATASSSEEAVQLAAVHAPDVVLLDVCDPLISLLATVREISRRAPDSATVTMTDQADEVMLFSAIAAGAKGYLTKELDGDEFCSLLSRIEFGEPALTPQMASRLLQAFVDSEPPPQPARRPIVLTQRERCVLNTMAQGVTSNRDLASALDVTENTVRFHVRNILEKLNLHTRAAAIAFAMRQGMVPGELGVGSGRGRRSQRRTREAIAPARD